jgi:glycosyltransferase involved in cell wall biosynthesis
MAATITIAIPFYSGLDYLRVAVQSVARQTMSDWRLIVCDDGGGEEGVENWLRERGDPRITYSHNDTRLGIVRNFNRCLDLADTDLVTILHADDRLLPGYCRLMTKSADKYPECVAFFCRAAIIDAKGRPCFSLPDYVKRFYVPAGDRAFFLKGEAGLTSILRGNFIMCPTVCYRTSLLGARRFATDWNMVQDLEFFCRLLIEGELLCGLRETVYAYRRHPGNATLAFNQSLLRFQEDARLYDGLAAKCESLGWAHARRVARRKQIVRLNLCYCICQDLVSGHIRRARQRIDFLRKMRI